MKSPSRWSLAARLVVTWPAGAIPSGGGITRQGDTLEELNDVVSDAVESRFHPGQHPRPFHLHFIEDWALLLA